MWLFFAGPTILLPDKISICKTLTSTFWLAFRCVEEEAAQKRLTYVTLFTPWISLCVFAPPPATGWMAIGNAMFFCIHSLYLAYKRMSSYDPQAV